MAPKRTELPRNPRQADLVRDVVLAHRGYQSYGNTALDVVRAEARDERIYSVHLELAGLGSWIRDASISYPSAEEVRRAKATLLAAYPKDEQLRRDLRRARYNPDGPLSETDLVMSVLVATQTFRNEIDASKNLGRRAKRLARAQAWNRLHAVLAGFDLGFLANQHRNNSFLGTAARGCLR